MEAFHVFFVNHSHLFTVEPKSGNVTIRALQDNIREITGVKPEDQVLLVSGGEVLDSDKVVRDCAGDGTSSNPVFLFQRCSRSSRDDVVHETEINELFQVIDDVIEQGLQLEAADPKVIYISIPERVRQCKDAASLAVQTCNRLVSEHHLLHQGWLALVGNMDDSITRLRRRVQRYQGNVEKLRQQHEKAASLLKDFNICLEQLKRIPLPPALIHPHLRSAKETSISSPDLTLYEWISVYDQESSLEDLASGIQEQLENADYSDISILFDAVVEQSKRDGREIKGINKRMQQLETNLNVVKAREQSILKTVQKTSHSQVDAGLLYDRVVEYREMMSDVYNMLREMRKLTGLFHQSKSEVLVNLRQRLGNWTVTTYEKIHQCHNHILLLEEKFVALRQRLELVRQVKETPTLFATAVCEVIRRTSLQKEFIAWYRQHLDRCTAFAKDEESIRTQITNKFERHFLRVLFPGMFDSFPSFFVTPIPSCDQHMPQISVEYLRQLRQKVKDLEQYLRVSSPQVFSRLNVRDASLPSHASVISMRREESFITQETMQNFSYLNKNCPSTTWLMGLDTADNSPSSVPTLQMCNSPPIRSESGTSMNIPAATSLNHISMLSETHENSTPPGSLGKSAPINIPVGSMRELKLSELSTPEDRIKGETMDMDELKDHDSSQFAVDDLQSRSQDLDFLKPIVLEITTLNRGLLDTRADLNNHREEFLDSFKLIGRYMKDLVKCYSKEYEARHQEFASDKEKEIAELRQQLQEKSDALEASNSMNKQLSAEMEELKSDSSSRIERLESDLQQLEAKLKTTESEIFKKLTIEYELQSEKLRAEHEETLEERDIEINKLNEQIKDITKEVEHLRVDPKSDAFRKSVTAEIRAELERDYKSKIDLLSQGLAQKHDEAVARYKKELNLELRLASQSYKISSNYLMLELDLLREALEERNGSDVVKYIQNDVNNRLVAEQGRGMSVMCIASVGTQTAPIVMSESSAPLIDDDAVVGQDAMVQSKMQEMSQSSSQMMSSVMVETRPQEVQADGSERVNCNEIHVQTKIGMKAMECMVSVQDITEGSTVLVIWDERRNSYILFSDSVYFHFVKESSARRLGLTATDMPRRNWIVGKVVHLDLCVIRKASNRYNLPVDTRVYRVDVDPAPQMDVRGRAPREI